MGLRVGVARSLGGRACRDLGALMTGQRGAVGHLRSRSKCHWAPCPGFHGKPCPRPPGVCGEGQATPRPTACWEGVLGWPSPPSGWLSHLCRDWLQTSWFSSAPSIAHSFPARRDKCHPGTGVGGKEVVPGARTQPCIPGLWLHVHVRVCQCVPCKRACIVGP